MVIFGERQFFVRMRFEDIDSGLFGVRERSFNDVNPGKVTVTQI